MQVLIKEESAVLNSSTEALGSISFFVLVTVPLMVWVCALAVIISSKKAVMKAVKRMLFCLEYKHSKGNERLQALNAQLQRRATKGGMLFGGG
jgi:hypothetical protein